MMVDKKVSNFTNPYDGFIEKHLKTYGYFSKSENDVQTEFDKWKKFKYSVSDLWGNKNESQAKLTFSNSSLMGRNTSEEEIKSLSLLRNESVLFSISSICNRSIKRCKSELESSTVAARWPVEMQVLKDRIRHIDYIPTSPEPLNLTVPNDLATYQPSKRGNIVFSYPVICGKKFNRSYNGSQISLDCDGKRKYSTMSLVFESRFESGNLAKAVQIDETSYELYLRSDLYTQGHCQWFYFRVENIKTGIKYKFSIVNLHKITGLCNFGMKPLMYSDKLAASQKIGWRRTGDDVTYCKNERSSKEDIDKKIQLHTLSWTVQFPYENDTVYFARSYPYTYSDLQDSLNDLIHDPIRSQWSEVETLCRTLAGNNVYLVTVTSPIETSTKKKVIVLTARIHPGETPSSWVMKGFLDYLTSELPTALRLRQDFIFKLIPMLNPDGVIVGNNRFSLSGHDLNRTYRTLMKELYPPTWHVRRLVRSMLESYDVSLYCDLHSHSRKTNMFIYGCESAPSSQKYLKEQIFPLILYQHAPDMFSFEQCKFRMHKQREGTGRVVMWAMGIFNSYTLEVSMAGSMVGCRKGTYFADYDYVRIAFHFCDAMVEYFDESKAKIFENQLAWKTAILHQLLDAGSTAEEPVPPKQQLHFRGESDSSGESLIEDVDDVNNEVKTSNPLSNPAREKSITGSDISKTSSVPKLKRKILRKRRRVTKTKEPEPKSKPKRISYRQSPLNRSTRPREIKKKKSTVSKSKSKSDQSNSPDDAWKIYDDKFEQRHRDVYMPSFMMMRPGSPRRTRLRSLLNLQRSIVAQAILLRETSPTHKKLAKGILKETEAVTEVLARELRLVSESDKLKKKNFSTTKVSSSKSEPANKVKPKTQCRPVSARIRSKPVNVPFKMSICSTTAICKYNGVMVP